MSGGQFPCPIVFRGPTGSAGQLAATHSQAFESWYANCPGLKVVVPSNPYDAKGLLKSAIRDNDPVIFMESEQMYGDKGEIPEGEFTLPLGVADIKRKGDDVTIVSFGKIIKEAYKAAEVLEKMESRLKLLTLEPFGPWTTIQFSNLLKKPIDWLYWRKLGPLVMSLQTLPIKFNNTYLITWMHLLRK